MRRSLRLAPSPCGLKCSGQQVLPVLRSGALTWTWHQSGPSRQHTNHLPAQAWFPRMLRALLEHRSVHETWSSHELTFAVSTRTRASHQRQKHAPISHEQRSRGPGSTARPPSSPRCAQPRRTHAVHAGSVNECGRAKSTRAQTYQSAPQAKYGAIEARTDFGTWAGERGNESLFDAPHHFLNTPQTRTHHAHTLSMHAACTAGRCSGGAVVRAIPTPAGAPSTLG